jgi:hypothetical protein
MAGVTDLIRKYTYLESYRKIKALKAEERTFLMP